MGVETMESAMAAATRRAHYCTATSIHPVDCLYSIDSYMLSTDEPPRPPLLRRPRRAPAFRSRRGSLLRQPADAVDADPEARGRTGRGPGRTRAAQGDADPGRSRHRRTRAPHRRRRRADEANPRAARQDPEAGTVRFGMFPTLGPYLLPHVVPSIRARFPQLELLLVEEKSDVLLARLHEGRLDAALLALPVHDEQLQVEFLFEEPFVLAVPEGHPLAQRESLSFEGTRRRTPAAARGRPLPARAGARCLPARRRQREGRVPGHQPGDAAADGRRQCRRDPAADARGEAAGGALGQHPPARLPRLETQPRDRDGLAQEFGDGHVPRSNWPRCSGSCRRNCWRPSTARRASRRRSRHEPAAARAAGRAVRDRLVVFADLAAGAEAGRVRRRHDATLPDAAAGRVGCGAFAKRCPAFVAGVPVAGGDAAAAGRFQRRCARAVARGLFDAAAKRRCRRPISRSAGKAWRTTPCCRASTSRNPDAGTTTAGRTNRRCRSTTSSAAAPTCT